jgi:integrase
MGKSALGSIRRLPSGNYQARIRRDGSQVSLGSYRTRREALAALAVPPPGDASSRALEVTSRQLVGEFAEQWWSSRAGHRAATRVRDRLILDNDLLPYFSEMALGDVSPADIQRYLAGLVARPLAPSSVRRIFTILDQLLDAAGDRELIAANPAERARLPRLARSEMRFLAPPELERLAVAMTERYRAMVLVMAYATLRIGEAAGLRRADLDLLAGTLRVANNLVELRGQLIEGPPKTEAGRRSMSLPASIRADLAVHLDRFAGEVYVFPAPDGGPLHPSLWRSTCWYPAVRSAGLRPLRVHDLKHTGVALLISAGVDPKEISRRVGHAAVAFTLDRYGHLLPEVDKQAGAKLEVLRSTATMR